LAQAQQDQLEYAQAEQEQAEMEEAARQEADPEVSEAEAEAEEAEADNEAVEGAEAWVCISSYVFKECMLVHTLVYREITISVSEFYIARSLNCVC
jgi:hypothetical protein